MSIIDSNELVRRARRGAAYDLDRDPSGARLTLGAAAATGRARQSA